MVRNLCSMLRQELHNLDKDSESRKQAMKALKLYMKELDSKTIPQFLALVSETMNVGSPASEFIISLYEVLARTHGIKIVPHIGNIMLSVVKTLSASTGSVALHQACAKVVQTFARYGIDPTTPDENKRSVIHSLCKPLSDCLMASKDSLSAGAALCLNALVESDNWRFASNKTVNELCLNVTGVLKGKVTQVNLLMSLVMSLAKHNALIVEAYARLLVHSGLRILQAGVFERNSQKRLSAIQMMNSLLKSLDPSSVFPELEIVIEKMENCQSDPMEYVNGAAYECLVTAKGITARNGYKFKQTLSHSGSNNITMTHSLDSSFTSHESQTLGSFNDSDSFHKSPISTSHSSCDNVYTNRKLWKHENGGVDVSLKDGILSSIGKGITTASDAYSESISQFQIGSESVSSNEDIVTKIKDGMNIEQIRDQRECDKRNAMIKNRSYYWVLVCFGFIFMVLSVLGSYMVFENEDNGKILVPT